MLELEKLRTENLELQSALKNNLMSMKDQDDSDRLRQEIRMLESLVAELREELRNKRPQTAGQQDWEDEKIDFEVRLQKANARVDAMQNEMTMSASKYAKELSRLKLLLSVRYLGDLFRRKRVLLIRCLLISITGESGSIKRKINSNLPLWSII
jgi:hypothetical protein